MSLVTTNIIVFTTATNSITTDLLNRFQCLLIVL
jgi:hypothetical protein